MSESPFSSRRAKKNGVTKSFVYCGWTSPSGAFMCVKQAGHTGNHRTVRT